MYQKLKYQHTEAQIYSFQKGEVNEYHLMLHVTDPTLSYQQQLDAVLDSYQQLIGQTLRGAVAVFKRYFLSDAANQADDVLASDTSDCAKSIIQQAPLDGTKLALWVYLPLMLHLESRFTKSN